MRLAGLGFPGQYWLVRVSKCVEVSMSLMSALTWIIVTAEFNVDTGGAMRLPALVEHFTPRPPQGPHWPRRGLRRWRGWQRQLLLEVVQVQVEAVVALRLGGQEQTSLTPLLASRTELGLVLAESPPQVNEPHVDEWPSDWLWSDLVCILLKNLRRNLPWSAPEYANLLTIALLPEFYFWQSAIKKLLCHKNQVKFWIIKISQRLSFIQMWKVYKVQ